MLKFQPFSLAFCWTLLLCLACCSGQNYHNTTVRSQSRNLSQEAFLSYEPLTTVNSLAAIDLDLKLIQEQLALELQVGRENALNVYTQGVFAYPAAVLVFLRPLPEEIVESLSEVFLGEGTGIPVSGLAIDGTTVQGELLYAEGQFVAVLYTDGEKPVDCHVGANPDPNLAGCFEQSGSLLVGDLGYFPYRYDPVSMNTPLGILQMLSLQAQALLYDCPSCPYVTYNKFYEYYGVFDYANQWVLAAFNSTETNFDNGNADFQVYGMEGTNEAIKKGILCMAIWMRVIESMERAVDFCEANCSGEACLDHASTSTLKTATIGPTRCQTFLADSDLFRDDFVDKDPEFVRFVALMTEVSYINYSSIPAELRAIFEKYAVNEQLPIAGTSDLGPGSNATLVSAFCKDFIDASDTLAAAGAYSNTTGRLLSSTMSPSAGSTQSFSTNAPFSSTLPPTTPLLYHPLSPIGSWDQAVAAYTGSAPKTSGSEGYLLYRLAQTRCANFGTCLTSTSEVGMAKVNSEIFRNFRLGQQQLLNGDCNAVEANVARITQWMTVPLVQSVLRSAYFQDKQDDDREKQQAEGATFAAAVLPLLHACSAIDADIVYKNMRVGNEGPPSFKDVKSAFERNYECLGITCEDVGGLLHIVKDGYIPGEEPCGHTRPPSTGSSRSTKLGLAVSASIGMIAPPLIAALWMGPKASKEEER